MIVAGIGFRSGATAASLASALDRLGSQPEALATVETKAEALRAIANRLQVISIPANTLREQVTLTDSPAAREAHGTGSVAEAAALAAAGPGARLTGPRVISEDGRATAALAVGGGA